jgi:hypothetical protein
MASRRSKSIGSGSRVRAERRPLSGRVWWTHIWLVPPNWRRRPWYSASAVWWSETVVLAASAWASGSSVQPPPSSRQTRRLVAVSSRAIAMPAGPAPMMQTSASTTSPAGTESSGVAMQGAPQDRVRDCRELYRAPSGLEGSGGSALVSTAAGGW